jgi:hypothetical protein
MATTVVPSAATTETFEAAFDRAVLQSERLRVTIVVIGMLFIVLRGIVLWVFVPASSGDHIGVSLHIAALGAIGLGTLAYEIAVLIRLTVILRRHGHLSRFVRFVSAFVEVSIPTLVMLFGPEVTSPAYALYTPPA